MPPETGPKKTNKRGSEESMCMGYDVYDVL
jgi:hypothetical protein